ncbi:hypothetical protein D3C78_1590980 [compost metagenome]
MLSTLFRQVCGHSPEAIGKPLHDTSPAQCLESANMTFDQRVGILPFGGLRPGQCEVMVGAVNTIRGQRSDRAIHRAWFAHGARLNYSADGVVGQLRAGRQRQVVSLAVEAIHHQIAAIV